MTREPEGDTLLVGSQQRYHVMVKTGDGQVPAQGVRWLRDFDNDYVSWKAPVLTAKKPGHEQRLGAMVGDQQVFWTTRTAANGEPPPASELTASPWPLCLDAGETKWLGKDLIVSRGGAARPRRVLDDVHVESSAPAIVRYNPLNHSIQGVEAGAAQLALTAGDQSCIVPVVVAPYIREKKGRLVIEPATDTLAAGEGRDLRVLLVTDGGNRLDCTGEAVVQSDDPACLAAVGNRVTGIKPGNGRITATLPRIAEPGRATFTVIDEKFTGLHVVPPSLHLGVGEQRTVRIFGIGSAKQYELSDHPDLKITIGGEQPGAVEGRGAGRFRGVAPDRRTSRSPGTAWTPRCPSRSATTSSPGFASCPARRPSTLARAPDSGCSPGAAIMRKRPFPKPTASRCRLAIRRLRRPGRA